MCSRRHTLLQPSPLTVLPSWQVSLPSILLLPQTGSTVHIDEQPSPEMLLPGEDPIGRRLAQSFAAKNPTGE
jgi:hypothetical protein